VLHEELLTLASCFESDMEKSNYTRKRN